MPETFHRDPFFWAVLSMFGMVMATSLFSRHALRRSRLFVAIALTLVTVGRIVLVLPYCPQPRFDASGWNWLAGGILLGLAGLVGAGPLFRIRWWSPPREGMTLRTTGIHGLVRHPIYLAEVLWPIGLSLGFRSIEGLALTPLWWAAFLIHALAEEADLEQTLGQEYSDYEQRVRGRLFPWVPV